MTPKQKLKRLLFGWSRSFSSCDCTPDMEKIAASAKQNELMTKVRQLVDHVQVISGRSDILWREYERRQDADPSLGERRRFSDRWQTPQIH